MTDNKKKPKAGELIPIVVALIRANIENVNKETFKDFTFRDEQHASDYKLGYRNGAIAYLRALEKQLTD